MKEHFFIDCLPLELEAGWGGGDPGAAGQWDRAEDVTFDVTPC